MNENKHSNLQTIEDLVLKNPKTLEELQEINGIGLTKATQYGEELLELLKNIEA